MYIFSFFLTECINAPLTLTGSMKSIVLNEHFALKQVCKIWLIHSVKGDNVIQFKISLEPSQSDFLEVRDGKSEDCNVMLARYPSKDKRYPLMADNITWTSREEYLIIKYNGSSSSHLRIDLWDLNSKGLKGNHLVR